MFMWKFIGYAFIAFILCAIAISTNQHAQLGTATNLGLALISSGVLMCGYLFISFRKFTQSSGSQAA